MKEVMMTLLTTMMRLPCDSKVAHERSQVSLVLTFLIGSDKEHYEMQMNAIRRANEFLENYYKNESWTEDSWYSDKWDAMRFRKRSIS